MHAYIQCAIFLLCLPTLASLQFRLAAAAAAQYVEVRLGRALVDERQVGRRVGVRGCRGEAGQGGLVVAPLLEQALLLLGKVNC